MGLYVNGVEKFGFPSTTSEKRMIWAPIREAVLSILGSTGTIIPLGDSQHEATNRTTCTSVGEKQAVFTYSEAVSSFDTAPTALGPAYVPIVTFNGTDEDADTPDDNYFSFGDGANDSAISMGMWVCPTNAGGAFQALMAKDNNTDREWAIRIDAPATPNPTLYLYDDSAGVFCARGLSAALTLSSWAFVVITYDGAGGATAANTINSYKNGALSNGGATNNGAYVAMENLAATPTIGSTNGQATKFYGGKMAGGPLGPFFVQAELSADAILRLYQLGRNYLGV